MRFLAVDDDSIFLELLKVQLAAMNYRDIVTASSAIAALAILNAEQKPFDTILLDIQMPGMNGIELCRKIRKITSYSQTPIVMITSEVDQSYIDEAFTAGATDYITKPLNRVELKARIGMVARLHVERQRVRVLGSNSASSAYNSGAGVSFDEATTLSNVERLTSYVALENYLLTLGSWRMNGLRAFAIQIDNAALFYSRFDQSTYLDMLGDVATSLLEGLKLENAMLAYAGKGIFVCLVREDSNLNLEDLQLSTEMSLTDFEEFYLSDRLPFPRLRFGEVIRSSIFTLNRPNKLLDRAVSRLPGHLTERTNDFAGRMAV